MPPISHRLHKLAVHVIDQRLQVSALSGSHVTARVAGVFQRADLQHFGLELGPAQQVAVIDPLGNHSDRTNHAAIVGINLIGRRRNVVRPTGPHRADRRHDALMLFVAQAFHFPINLLRGGHAAAGRIHLQDNGFDRIVVSELLKLRHDNARIQDHAFQFDDSNLVAKAV